MPPPTPPIERAPADAGAPIPLSHPGLAYPEAPREDVKDVLHGVTVDDPYRWLEDAKSPRTRAWMAAEDKLARDTLKQLPERDAIAARLRELLYIDKLDPPSREGDRYFFHRRHADKEKGVVYWRQGKTGDPHVLFDPNTWSADGSVSLGGWSVSHDGKLVAFQVKKNNSDDATLKVMEVESGKIRDIDQIAGGRHAYASWTPKGDGFYYTWYPTDPAIKDADKPGYQEIRYHKLGTDPSTDPVIHAKTGDPAVYLSGYLSRSGRWFITTLGHGWTSEDVYLTDLHSPKREPRPLAVDRKAHYSVDVFKDRLFIKTDEGAPHSRVFVADATKPEREHWREIVPERADAVLDSARVIGGKLVLTYLKNATSRLEIHELDGKLAREVELPGLGSIGGIVGREDDDSAYFGFESFITPSTIFELSVKTGATQVYSKVDVRVDTSPYTVEQVFYPSKDGTRVSMFIVRRKDMKRDGRARGLLSGYGGFQISMTPAFYSGRIPWLERGGFYAVANLRGGGEYGEDWHKHGMLLEKQNVFDDFAAAGRYLVTEGYTKADRLAIRGGSNGGLLVGAAMTQHPELFSAVVCEVPLLDMIRYPKSGIGTVWVDEYGSPENPDQFKALFAYSPYHHVTAGTKYPALLVLSADSDDRVDPMHARKFTAAMQAASAGGPVLLRIQANAGHGGADLLKATVEEGADLYAFLLAHTASD